MMKSMEDSRVAGAASVVKLGCVAVVLIAIVALAGCSAQQGTTQTAGDQGAQQQSMGASASGDATGAAKGAAQQDANTLDGIIAGIEADFESTEADIAAQLEDVKSKAGGSYADYSANKDLLANWFTYSHKSSPTVISTSYDSHSFTGAANTFPPCSSIKMPPTMPTQRPATISLGESSGSCTMSGAASTPPK